MTEEKTLLNYKEETAWRLTVDDVESVLRDNKYGDNNIPQEVLDKAHDLVCQKFNVIDWHEQLTDFLSSCELI